MEYFLYGVSEADRLVQSVRVMEGEIDALADRYEAI